jgi:hypothetical protein
MMIADVIVARVTTPPEWTRASTVFRSVSFAEARFATWWKGNAINRRPVETVWATIRVPSAWASASAAGWPCGRRREIAWALSLPGAAPPGRSSPTTGRSAAIRTPDVPPSHQLVELRTTEKLWALRQGRRRRRRSLKRAFATLNIRQPLGFGILSRSASPHEVSFVSAFSAGLVLSKDNHLDHMEILFRELRC